MQYSAHYSVHSPHPYLCSHQAQLLPDWANPVLSVLVVLQRCPFILSDRTLRTEACKNRLRQQFIKLSANITQTLRENNYRAAAFDPRTGLPIDSLAGSLRLDDVAVVQSLLGYAIDRAGECAVILHPDWGKAVYPSILLSSATPQMLSLAVQNVVASIQPIASL